MKIDSIERVEPTFPDIKRWYEENLHPDSNDYDDQEVFKNVYHDGRFCAVFQCSSRGAQSLFKKAKPQSIVDIAMITSIYRPGPLAANVDKLYLEAKNGNSFEWDHPLFEKVLGKTYNLLIFQEQIMDLAEHVAGFPRVECDNVRKAIIKRDQSKAESAVKASLALEESFVAGAMKNGIPEAVARKSYQQILWMAGYCFNRAHAVAYAIDSYMCAWLFTHYEEEWLTTYLESMSGNADDRAQAFGEVKRLGYTIAPLDVNHAGHGWTVLPGKRFMPSLTSCDSVGTSAVDELISMRPFNTIEELLYNEDGTWRPSKFNKRALSSLIKVGAFDSLECVGEGRLFESYRHMYEVLIENGDAIKKSTKKDPYIGKKTMFELARALRPMPEWTRRERVDNMIEVFGSLDVSALLEPRIAERLEELNVKSIDEWTEKGLHWFCVKSAVVKKGKTGKQYIMFEAVGPVGKVYKLNAWGWDGKREFTPFSVLVSEVDRNDYGFSCVLWRCKEIA